MPERRRVMRKCVHGSPDAVGEEEDDEESCGVGGEARRAATVREAVVPLWTEHRCIMRRELRSPLGMRVGRTTLSMVVAVQCKCDWLARHKHRDESEPSHWFLTPSSLVSNTYSSLTRAQAEIVKLRTAVETVHGTDRLQANSSPGSMIPPSPSPTSQVTASTV
jgi:hypothetical protein